MRLPHWALAWASAAALDAKNSVAFEGTLKFSGTASCAAIYEDSKAKLLEALNMEEDAVEVLIPAVVSAGAAHSFKEACDGKSNKTGTWTVSFTALSSNEMYSKHEQDVGQGVIDDLMTYWNLDLPDFADLKVEVKFVKFELLFGELELEVQAECDRVLAGTRSAIAEVLGISPLFVVAEHPCNDPQLEFPGEAEPKMQFQILDPVIVTSLEDARYSAEHVQKSLREGLSMALRKTLEIGASEAAAFELKAVAIIDFQPGDQELLQPETLEGSVTFLARNASCTKTRFSMEAALIQLWQLNEKTVLVTPLASCKDDELLDNTEWTLSFTTTWLVMDREEQLRRCQIMLNTSFAEVLAEKLEDAQCVVEEDFELLAAEMKEAAEPEAESQSDEDAGESTASRPPPTLAKTYASKAELSSALRGNLSFQAAASCREIQKVIHASVAEVFGVTMSAVAVGYPEHCDDGAIQELSSRSVTFQAVVPEAQYGVANITRASTVIKGGLPPMVGAHFLSDGVGLEDDIFSMDVSIEHVQIELMSCQATIKAEATCGQVTTALSAAVAFALHINAIYVNVQEPCPKEDSDVGAEHHAARMWPEAGVDVSFNVTLPAQTADVNQEIYRASHVDETLKKSLKSALQKQLDSLRRENTTMELESAMVMGFTSPEVDSWGDQSHPLTDDDSWNFLPPADKIIMGKKRRFWTTIFGIGFAAFCFAFLLTIIARPRPQERHGYEGTEMAARASGGAG